MKFIILNPYKGNTNIKLVGIREALVIKVFYLFITSARCIETDRTYTCL